MVSPVLGPLPRGPPSPPAPPLGHRQLPTHPRRPRPVLLPPGCAVHRSGGRSPRATPIHLPPTTLPPPRSPLLSVPLPAPRGPAPPFFRLRRSPAPPPGVRSSSSGPGCRHAGLPRSLSAHQARCARLRAPPPPRPGATFATQMLSDHHSTVVRPLVPRSPLCARTCIWVHAAGARVVINSSWMACSLTFLFSTPSDRFRVLHPLPGVFSADVASPAIAGGILRCGRASFGGTAILMLPSRLEAIQRAFFQTPVAKVSVPVASTPDVAVDPPPPELRGSPATSRPFALNVAGVGAQLSRAASLPPVSPAPFVESPGRYPLCP